VRVQPGVGDPGRGRRQPASQQQPPAIAGGNQSLR
jgi:hypothetical protein